MLELKSLYKYAAQELVRRQDTMAVARQIVEIMHNGHA